MCNAFDVQHRDGSHAVSHRDSSQPPPLPCTVAPGVGRALNRAVEALGGQCRAVPEETCHDWCWCEGQPVQGPFGSRFGGLGTLIPPPPPAARCAPSDGPPTAVS